MNKEAYVKRLIKIEQLRTEMQDLLLECMDDGVERYFDYESDRMLGKKIRVLRRLNGGDSPEEIGKDYYDILEKLDVPDGQAVQIDGEVLDPREFD